MAERSTLPIPLGPPGQDTVTATTCLNENEILAFVQGLWENEHLETLHAHLDGCETCQQLVNEAAHALNTASDLEVDEESTTFQKGVVVGQRYLILRFIARGGMGEVYEAFDRTLKERVALKTVASSVSQSLRAVRRLKAEAQLARRVSHPNVCRIYDVGTHEMEGTNGVIHFLTMELVQGESLGQRIRSTGSLPIACAQKIVRQVLLGLSAAHQAGILHRDFKSDNVMLRETGTDEPTAVVMDFGLARALGRDTARLTTGRNQGLIGTIAFMAPEQIENKPLTAASDLYSFGIVWFEMLTGKLPFAGGTLAASALERFKRSPPAPSSLNPLVPKSLDPIVLRCLNRSPELRFTSAEQVLEALESVDESFSVGPKSGARLQTRVATAIAAVILAMAGLATWAGLRFHRSTFENRHEWPKAELVPPALAAASPERKQDAPTPSATIAEESKPEPNAVTGPVPAAGKPANAAPTLPRAGHAVPKTATSSRSETAAGAPAPSATAVVPEAIASPPAPTRAIEAPPPVTKPKDPDWEDPFEKMPSDEHQKVEQPDLKK